MKQRGSLTTLVGVLGLFGFVGGFTGCSNDSKVTQTQVSPVSSCVAGARPAIDTRIALKPLVSNLSFSAPVLFLQQPGNSSLDYVVEQGGVIKVFDASAEVPQADTFVDLSSRVNAEPAEGGLLGMAFHPHFAENHLVFLSFTDSGPNGLRSVVAKYSATEDGRSLNPDSEQIVLTIDQPYGNHNGGNIVFGPDGFLYLGYGDGGAAGDPQNRAQNLDTLLGKMLRIDVDSASPYGIPPDNPFANGGGRGELFAWGLRNPWRFSFDRETGELWVGDVGQDHIEEVDLVKKGGNYGWNVKEADECFSTTPCTGPYIDPIVQYDHSQGVSITGGYVYRGKSIDALLGSYLYADFKTGLLWRIIHDPSSGDALPELLLETGLSISSFGETNEGEIVVLDYYSGRLFQLVSSGGTTTNSLPEKLSDTGCYNSSGVPADGLIPYEINAPFWSDGAEKKRWISLPQGRTVAVGPDGDLDLPNGTVVVKEFSLGDRRIETRLFMRHDDGGWAGYSYFWDDDQHDATLLKGAKNVEFDGQIWHFPSRAECMQCHSGAAGYTLGLELSQLDRRITTQSNTPIEQLEYLKEKNVVPSTVEAPTATLVDPFADASLSTRARSYLHSNCSFCHRPGGTGQGEIDLLFATSLTDTKICNTMPSQGDLGIEGARLVSPANPEQSVLLYRVEHQDANRMPPLASQIVDSKGAELLREWITGLNSCN